LSSVLAQSLELVHTAGVTNEKQQTRTLAQVVGIRFRVHREEAGLTQDEVAAAAQRLGFAWGRSSVAALEQGTRDLGAAELLALPFIWAEASAQQPGFTAAGMSLFELISPGLNVKVALSDELVLTYKQAKSFIDEGGQAYRVKAGGAVVTEAEQKAAVRLDVAVDDLQAAAFVLWDRSMPNERDRRVAKQKKPEASARTVQALRGHVTRELLTELAEHLGVEL